MSYPSYVDPAVVASALGLDYSDVQVASEIATALLFVEPVVEAYCKTSFLAETGAVKTFSGNGTQMLTLGYFLRTLTLVEILDVTGNVLIDFTSFVQPMPMPPKHGLYRWLECHVFNPIFLNETRTTFPVGLNNIRITGDWGITLPLPKDLQLAIIMAVNHFFQMRDYSDLKKMEAGFGQTIQWADVSSVHPLPLMSRRLLDNWKNAKIFADLSSGGYND